MYLLTVSYVIFMNGNRLIKAFTRLFYTFYNKYVITRLVRAIYSKSLDHTHEAYDDVFRPSINAKHHTTHRPGYRL